MCGGERTEVGTSGTGGTRVFSDDSRFAFLHSYGHARVHRMQGETGLIDASSTQPTDDNRGPSVMVWGAIHHSRRSDLVVLDGTPNRQHYISFLRDSMLLWAMSAFGQEQMNQEPNIL